MQLGVLLKGAKSYDEALKHYSKVLLSSKILSENKSDKEEDKVKINKLFVDEIIVPTYLNMAYINLKRLEYENVINYTSRILDNFDKDNEKARYRRTFAYIKLGKLVEAKKDMDVLKIKLKGTTEYDSLLEEYDKQDKKSNFDRESFYKKMSIKNKASNRKNGNIVYRLYYFFESKYNKVINVLERNVIGFEQIYALACVPYRLCCGKKKKKV